MNSPSKNKKNLKNNFSSELEKEEEEDNRKQTTPTILTKKRERNDSADSGDLVEEILRDRPNRTNANVKEEKVGVPSANSASSEVLKEPEAYQEEDKAAKKNKKKSKSLHTRFKGYRDMAIEIIAKKGLPNPKPDPGESVKENSNVTINKIKQISINNNIIINRTNEIPNLEDILPREILPYDPDLEKRDRKVFGQQPEIKYKVHEDDIRKKESLNNLLANRKRKTFVLAKEKDSDEEVRLNIIEELNNYKLKDYIIIHSYVEAKRLEKFFNSDESVRLFLEETVLKLKVDNHNDINAHNLIKKIKMNNYIGVVQEEGEDIFLLINFTCPFLNLANEFILVKVKNQELKQRLKILSDNVYESPMQIESDEEILDINQIASFSNNSPVQQENNLNNANEIIPHLNKLRIESAPIRQPEPINNNYTNPAEENNYQLKQENEFFKKKIAELTNENEKIKQNSEDQIKKYQSIVRKMTEQFNVIKKSNDDYSNKFKDLQSKNKQLLEDKAKLEKNKSSVYIPNNNNIQNNQNNQNKTSLFPKNLKVIQSEKVEIIKNIFNPKQNVRVDDFIITEVAENFTDKSPSVISDNRSEFDDKTRCFKCFTNPKNCIFFKCGHFAWCWSCLLDMNVVAELPSKNNRKKKLAKYLACPVCKVENDHIFLAIPPY